MAGAAATPVPIAVLNDGAGGASNNVFDPSKVNSFRISAVIDRLSIHVRGSGNNDTTEFLNLCLSLARGIDFAIANHEVPSRGQELPSLLKQVCQCKNDDLLQSAIMVLMVSVKNACQCGWFSDKDSNELRNQAKEVASNFCGISNYDTEATCSRSVISTIMSRFYPRMRMGHKLAFLEVKPGFDAYMSGFHISKNLKPSPGEKIRLFVVQTDSIMTSSCLISPSKVNFLLNGKGVEMRINVSMDMGPQIPTDVTRMLKYGSNLLQAVGEFNGNYVIAVSFMRDLPNPDGSDLQDYEQPAPATVDSDSEIIEGPSRISLNCPISFKRIRTPVKGQSCKHIQCFDFDNYVDINSRRPSWRCPHCNQHVCFTDIRVDQKMVKVLKDVGTIITEIIVASDGSWKAAFEIDTGKPVDKTSNIGQDESPHCESVGLSNAPVNVMDLTHTDDTINYVLTHETGDRKLSPISSQRQSSPIMIVNPQVETNDANQSSSQVKNDFRSEIFPSTFGQVSSNVQLMAQISGVSVTSSNNVMLPAVLNDPLAPCPSQEVEAFHGNAFVTTSIAQIETSLPATLQLQQYQFGNSTMTNEYGRFPSIPRHISRTPTAVQALPAQAPISVLQKRSRSSVNTSIQNGVSVTSQASPTAQISSTTPRTNPFHVSQRSSSPSHQFMGVQRNHSFPSIGPPLLNVPDRVRNTCRVLNEQQSSTPLQMVNPRMPQAASQSPAMIQSSVQSSANFLRPQSQMGVSRDRTDHPAGAISVQQAHTMAAAHRNVHMTRPVETSRTTPSYAMAPDRRRMQDKGGNTGVTALPVTIDVYDSAEQNWRPAGRMRGALTGHAYNDALNQYIFRPSQQAQTARPINPSSAVSNVPAHLQPLMADRAAQRPSAPNYPSAGSATRPGGSSILP